MPTSRYKLGLRNHPVCAFSEDGERDKVMNTHLILRKYQYRRQVLSTFYVDPHLPSRTLGANLLQEHTFLNDIFNSITSIIFKFPLLPRLHLLNAFPVSIQGGRPTRADCRIAKVRRGVQATLPLVRD